ncbi:hypothetical protein L6586_002936 [Listeria monocytogenes]|nr:hypothetical protein [Listeria monocytogenes]
MKKRMYCLVMLLAFVLLVSLSNQQVAASETGNDDKEIQTLYQKAINEKKVDPNKLVNKFFIMCSFASFSFWPELFYYLIKFKLAKQNICLYNLIHK